MAKHPDPRSEAFAAAGERRFELKAALSGVEAAAASPAAAPDWRRALSVALIQLADALDVHVDEVERPDGLLAELIETSPRLANRVDRLREEHTPLQERMATLVDLARVTGDDQPSPDALRTEILAVLVDIARHRQRGADLVYEVANVDIGGG